MNDFIQTALTDATSDARSFVVGEATTVIVPPEVFQEPTYTVNVSPSTVVEGGEFVVRAVTTNLSNSTTLFVTVGGTGSAVSDDFGVNHWVMVINNNKGVVRLSPKIDSILESGETVQFQLRTVRATGPIAATTSLALITDIPAPVQPPALPPRPPAEPFPADPVEPPGPTKTYSISVSPTTLVEGSYNLVAIYTTNVPDGTQLFVTVGGSGNATSNDFIGYPLTTTVANGNASRTVFAILDGIVETETVQFELRTGSPTGPIVATSGLLSVLDNAGGGGQPPIDNSTYFAMVSPTVADEGNLFVVTVATSGVANGTVLYMTQSGTTSDSDFVGSPWTLTVSNNEATATVATVADGTSEGNEIAVFHIRTGSAAGPIVATTPSVTIRNPGSNAASYSISTSPAIVGEGGTVNVTVTTTNVPNGTVLFIGLDGNSSTGYSDFIGAPWAITINNNSGSRTITIDSDNVAESNETFQFNLKTGSPSGTIVAIANTVTIDPALSASTYSIGSIPSSLNEGDVFVVSVTTTNVANGTILYLTKSDSSSVSNNDFVSLPNSITINNGTGSTSLSLKNDVTTEGAESAQFVLRTGSITGPIVATTTSVNIVDTSTTSTPPVEQFDSLLTTRLAGKSPIGVYYESWGDFTLANINPPVNVVNIAHVQPNCSYVAGSLSFVGSNLGFFSNTFAEVKAAITTLKSKGIIVLLSIGALSSNPFNLGTYNPASIISLCDDLGCDGVDLDWESPIDNTLFGPLIQATRNAAGLTRIVTAAVVSTGAYGTGSYVSAPPLGSVYSNLNRPGLVSHGTLLDGINIMAYDSSTALSTTQCIDSYADCYAGPLIVGFQVPPEGWGDHVVTLPEVTSVVSYIRELSATNGFFVWSYKKIGTPTAQQIIDTGAGVAPTPPIYNSTLSIGSGPLSYPEGTTAYAFFSVSPALGSIGAASAGVTPTNGATGTDITGNLYVAYNSGAGYTTDTSVFAGTINVPLGTTSIRLSTNIASDALTETGEGLSFSIQPSAVLPFSSTTVVSQTINITDAGTGGGGASTIAVIAGSSAIEGNFAYATYSVSPASSASATVVATVAGESGASEADLVRPLQAQYSSNSGSNYSVLVDVPANGIITVPAGTNRIRLGVMVATDALTETSETLKFVVAQSAEGVFTNSWYVSQLINITDSGGGGNVGSSTIAYVTNTQPSQNNPFYNQSISVRYSVVAASNLSVYSRLLVRDGSGNIINTNYAGYYDSVCTRTSTDSGVTWSSWTYLSGPNGIGIVTDGFLNTIATGTYLLEIRVIKSTTFALPASWEFDIELTDTGWSSNGTHLINNIPFVLGTA